MNVSGRLLNCVSACVSPVFSSISLDLLPERVATLMVYEDVVEIVSDLQGKKKKSNKKTPKPKCVSVEHVCHSPECLNELQLH